MLRIEKDDKINLSYNVGLINRGQPKAGKLVGTDNLGNEYYENRLDVSGYLINRSRSLGNLFKMGP